MSELEFAEMMFIIGIAVEGFFYGIYSAIFCMYIRYRASKELGIDKRNILLYALCILYILSTVMVVIDVTGFVVAEVPDPLGPSQPPLGALYYILTTIDTLCDFIYQAVLVYRCWIIWGHNIRVIIVPLVLALAFLATWFATFGTFYIARSADGALLINALGLKLTALGYTMYLTYHSISLTVNAVVTFLIALKIIKVYKDVMPISKDQTLGIGRAETKFRSIIFIIIESGMALFTIQLIRLILIIHGHDAVFIITPISQMFSGLIPTTIFMRMSMGLSYHDEQSMVQTAASWRFIPYNQNSVSGTRDTENVGRERLDPISIHSSDDIEIVDR